MSGWVPSVLRDCPFSAIYWLGFETLRPIYAGVIFKNAFISPPNPQNKTNTPTTITGVPTIPSPTEAVTATTSEPTATSAAPNFARDGYPSVITFLSGATAGMIAAVCTHPFDVLKTRRQVAAWHVNSNNNLAAAGGSATTTTPGKCAAVSVGVFAVASLYPVCAVLPIVLLTFCVSCL